MGQGCPEPMSDTCSTAWTATTPPETILGEDEKTCSKSTEITSSVPWPNSTFIINAVKGPERVITFLDGQIILAPPGGRGTFRWDCIESKGWLAFRDPASGRYLGRDKAGRVGCWALHHDGWERFCARQIPEGGYVLFMKNGEVLWPLKIVQENGKEFLQRAEAPAAHGFVWRFVKC